MVAWLHRLMDRLCPSFDWLDGLFQHDLPIIDADLRIFTGKKPDGDS
ncbi:hypothetical protein BAJUN_02040 [Bajunvirus bajun]|uniref:Uncharacterized protein n=1 Tax=Brevundimonas phage vB_BgoS-Bajun TaxID=2948594 RepID=A0A9E7N7J9_9CAUD|nr:hypothetical protein BAJUN_02040 [Brevundimonas phage vB_BgoS-Bajun]